jgi:hypothetical protein
MTPPTPLVSIFDSSQPYAASVEASNFPANLDDSLTLIAQTLSTAEATHYGAQHEIDGEAELIKSRDAKSEESKAEDAKIRKQMREVAEEREKARNASNGDGVSECARIYRQLQGQSKKIQSEMAALAAMNEQSAAIIHSYQQDIKMIEGAFDPLKKRYHQLEAFAQTPVFTPSAIQPLQVSPTGVNSNAAFPRYTRILAWNLENFTRDARPRGSAPIDSLRNQARIAVTAFLSYQLGVDVVLMMETGTDVGPATTHLATALQQLQATGPPDNRQWHPLTSPATHLIPTVSMDYIQVRLGRPTGDRVLALNALCSAFNIAPHKSVLMKIKNQESHVTADQMMDSCRILLQSSSYVKEFGALPYNYATGLDANACIQLGNKNACPGPSWFYMLWGASMDLGDPWWDLQRWGDTLYSQPLTPQQLLQIAEYILQLRDFIDSSRRGFDPPALAGFAESVELALLFTLKAHNFMTLDPPLRQLWVCETPEVPSIPLLALYCTSVQQVNLLAQDRDLGPIASAYDPEVLLNALRRIGVVKYNLETYGIAYRPWRNEALAQFFEIKPEGQGPFDANGIYGIVRKDALGGDLSVQQPGNVLSGRSALQLMIPTPTGDWIPLSLLHNRFTGTADIRDSDELATTSQFTKDEKVLRARVLTLLEIARAGAMQKFPPLLLGDFNFPDTLIEPEPEPDGESQKRAWRRRSQLREELAFGMRLHGYVRRTKGAPQSRTSLVSYASIASGVTVYSQPYDAVYQPFDLMNGVSLVRSGAVFSIDTILPDVLMNSILQAIAPDLSSAADVKVDDDDDKAELDEGDMQVIDTPSSSSPAQKKQMTVNEAFAFEISRVYRSLNRQAKKVIELCLDWIRREAINPNTSEVRLDALMKLTEIDVFDASIQKRASAFFEAIKPNLRKVLNVLNPDPMDDWIGYARLALTKPSLKPPKQIGDLVAILTNVKTQLQNLETNPTIRLWIGYRAVVSDHLPIIAEVDLKPY